MGEVGFLYRGEREAEVNSVLAGLCGAFREELGAHMKGLYLHGSMAMGSFRPWSSDIDLLAVTHGPMDRESKLRLVYRVMEIAEGGQEFRKVEFSAVTASEAARAVHPIGYILHYSDNWHQAYKGGNAGLVVEGGPDEDLAAHFMVARRRGVALLGAPIGETIGQVSQGDYLKAVWCDIAGSREAAPGKPVDTLLNLCRTWMFLETGAVGSKLEGGKWAAGRPELLPFRTGIEAAALEYQSGTPFRCEADFLTQTVDALLALILPRIK